MYTAFKQVQVMPIPSMQLPFYVTPTYLPSLLCYTYISCFRPIFQLAYSYNIHNWAFNLHFLRVSLQAYVLPVFSFILSLHNTGDWQIPDRFMCLKE